MNRKVLLSIVILVGALGQMYNHYVNGISYNKLVIRDSSGFVVDGLKVKITASQEDMEAYKKLITGEVVKDIQSQLKDVEKQQQEMMNKLDDIAGIDETSTKTVVPQQSALPPLPEDLTERQALEEPIHSAPLLEEDKEASPEPEKVSQFDPIKELAARNLMSCKTKNSKGRIPILIWNYIVSKSSTTKYVTTGKETLPRIAVILLNDESCWPKLWSQNPALENPYEIPSGLTISVVPDTPRVPANSETAQ